MRSQPPQALFLQISLLISSITSKKSLKKHKTDLFYLLSLLGPQSEGLFLINLLRQINLSELKDPLNENNEKPSKIRAALFLQRLEKIQDSLQILDVFPEIMEDFVINRHMSLYEAFVLLIDCFKVSIRLEIILIFSLIFCGAYTPQILDLFLSKFAEFFNPDSSNKSLEDLFSPSQAPILDFLRSDPTIEPLRQKFPGFFLEKPIDLNPERPLIEDNPQYKKFLNLDFCLKPNELLQEFTGSPQEIIKLFPKTSFHDDEFSLCLGSIAKTYPVLEDLSQRLLNKLLENQGNIDTINDKSLEKKTMNFNLEAFMKTFPDSTIKPAQILQKLDKKTFRKLFKDPKIFANFIKIIQRFRKIYNLPFPVHLLFSKWINIHSQIQFLLTLFNTGSPDLISWAEIQQKRVISLDFNPTLRYASLSPAILQFWCCLDFLEILIESSESEYFAQIRNLFELPLGKTPDLLIIGLSQIKPKCGFVLLEELFSGLFPLYLLNHSNSIPILEALWKYNEKLMIEAIFALYKKENSSLNLSRVLDITQEIKDSLIPLTNCNFLNFSVSLGILASKREFLHFEHWLNERLKLSGNPFITSLLKYIEENVLFHCETIEKMPQNPVTNFQNACLSILEKAQLSLETLGIIMENLLGNGFDKLSIKNQKKSQEVFAGICKFFPPLAGVHESAKLEIENAANMYFQRYYYKEMKVEELMELLGKLKSSNNPSEKEIHACMLHYLFDEFRHHEEYSPEVLVMTGSIFGNLINSKMLDGSPLLEMALQCVRYCLEKGSIKRVDFAKEALNCCKRRMHELFDFFQSLFYIENIKEKLSDFLYELFEDSKRAGRPFEIKPDVLYYLQTQKTPLFTKQFEPQKASLGSKTMNLQYPTKIQIPSNEPSINILEFINKQNEETEPIEEETMNQMTFHLNSLCQSNLVEKGPELRKILEKNENAQKWLARTLVFKRVIQETLTKNNYLQLLILLQIKNLNKLVLKETFSCIHKLLNLQVSANEKAAIQVKNFLKNLGFWLGHLTLARNKPIIIKSLNLKVLLNEALVNNRLQIIVPFICKILEASKNSEVFDLNNPWIKGILAILNEILKNEDVKQTLKQEIKLLFNSLELDGKTFDKTLTSEAFLPTKPDSSSNASNELNFLSMNSNVLTKYIQKIANLREIISKVLTKSIIELLNPVISRTVTIAMITGKKLANKDFALDCSDQRFEHGTGFIVQNLAFSLALATAKEPLRNSIQQGLANELQTFGLTEQEFEEILEGVINENMDNAISFIQRKVQERANLELTQDSEVKEGIEKRKQGNYQPDEGFLKNLEVLPMVLKPDLKGLNEEEFRVYEYFNKEEAMAKESMENIGEKTVIMNWLNTIQSLDNLIEEINEVDLMNFLNSFKDFFNANGGFNENQTIDFAMSFIQIVVLKPRKSELLLKTVQFLAGKHIKRVSKEIKNFLLNLQENVLNDHAKFNETLLLNLFNFKLLNEKSLDKVCGTLLKKPLVNVQNSIVKTLSFLIFTSKQITPKDCLLSSVSFGNIEKSNENVIKFLENLNKFSSFAVRTNRKAEILEFLEKKSPFHEKIYELFQRFLLLFFNKVKNEALSLEILNNFETLFLHESEEISMKTFAILLELSIVHTTNSLQYIRKLGILDMDFTLLDAFEILFIQIFIRIKERTRLLENFLEAFESVLSLIHRNDPGFNQRPFSHLLMGLIEEMAKIEGNLIELYFITVKKMLDISPNKFPGFIIGWIELLGHHLLVPSILMKEELQYSYHLLLIELMRFFKKIINEEEMKKSVGFKTCYLAILKLMLVLLHDFPEFLAVFAMNLCNEIPEGFIQIRNIVLAAFPKNMRLIDPFQITDVNKIENFKEMPKIFFKDFEEKIAELSLHDNFKVHIREFITGRKGVVLTILEKFKTFEGITDIHAVNAFVVGIPWILYSNPAKNNAFFWDNKTEAENLLIQMLKKAGFEIREVLLNCVMNQIRYPNLLSQFFINLILTIFNDRNLGVLHEQIARVIVERLIIEKPHPWGLMFTFIELIRNPGYCFKEIFSENLFNIIIQRIFNSLNIS